MKKHCSSRSNSAWCDLNSTGDILKLHGIYPKPKCQCQKQFTFTPRQFQLEGARVINKSQKTFKGTQTA